MSVLSIPIAQRQRLAYIDFCLLFRGHLCRNDLIQRFEVGLSAGSRDFKLYQELAPDNLHYNPKAKRYFQSDAFNPLFKHDPKQTLLKLAHGITDGFDAISDIHFPVEAPAQLNVPNLFIVARITQAILNNLPVNLIYTSLSSGSKARIFIPHSIIDNGLRWHVRGYDRETNAFRDFVLTRISKVLLLSQIPSSHESIVEDHQWNREIILKIAPHPKNVSQPIAIALDYGMVDQVLEIKTRAALAGYILRRWNVDCSEHAKLMGAEFQLYLINQSSIFGAENLKLAPGYNN
jgi:predicted DNA-binding transcriptional regulator YafY